jgi:peroxiredoxin
MISKQTIERKESESGKEKKYSPDFSVKVGDVIKPFELETILGKVIRIPDTKRKVHLKFRRYSGCPICNLHMRSIAKRNEELLASDVREVAVFHSTRETMLQFQGQLPFDTIADPEKKIYGKFGADRKMSALSGLNPRTWVAAINALARAPSLKGARGNGEDSMGLPSDFLIDVNGKILAVNYGKRVDDHWSVDRVLSMARE